MICTFFIAAYPIPSVCCFGLIAKKLEPSKSTGISIAIIAQIYDINNRIVSLLDKTICVPLLNSVIFSIKSNKIKNKQPPLISNINIDLFITSLTNPNRFFIILFHYLLQFNFDFFNFCHKTSLLSIVQAPSSFTLYPSGVTQFL